MTRPALITVCQQKPRRRAVVKAARRPTLDQFYPVRFIGLLPAALSALSFAACAPWVMARAASSKLGVVLRDKEATLSLSMPRSSVTRFKTPESQSC